MSTPKGRIPEYWIPWRALFLSAKNAEIEKKGLGLGIFIGKTLLEKNFANLNCRNSKTRSGAEVLIKWKNSDLFKI